MIKKFGDFFEPILQGLESDVLLKAEGGDIKEEDHITTTLFTLMEERLNGRAATNLVDKAGDGFTLSARQFTGRGRRSEESLVGADGALGLRINVGGLQIQKFFLFQAKKFDAKSKFDSRAASQRKRMLECTPDSFFLVYTDKKIYWVSAFLVEQGDKLSDLPSKSFTEFNQDFLNCFIGDHFFGFPDLPYGRPWRYWPYDEYPAKNNLIITISDK